MADGSAPDPASLSPGLYEQLVTRRIASAMESIRHRVRTGTLPPAEAPAIPAAHYHDHRGDRPIAITWRLDHPLPPDFYQEARAVA